MAKKRYYSDRDGSYCRDHDCTGSIILQRREPLDGIDQKIAGAAILALL